MHRVRVTEQGSETGAFQLSSPRSERGEDQGEGRFWLHSYGLEGGIPTQMERANFSAPQLMHTAFAGLRVFVRRAGRMAP